MSPRVVVIGSINVDLFTHVSHHPVPGETILGTGGHRSPGGKGANQALAARLQGTPVGLVGATGTDTDSSIALQLLDSADVDLSQVRALPDSPTGLAIITVSADGENSIIVIPGANAAFPPAHAVTAVSSLSAGDLVLMQGELPVALTATTLRATAAAGHRAVLNLAPYAQLPADVLRLVDPLVVNEIEGSAVATQLGITATDEEETVAELVRAGIPSVVMTLGARGSLVADPAGVAAVPTPQVAALDTTGAGDAFTGALCARLVAGDPLRSAAQHAARVGAYAVQRHGAQPSYPTSADELP